MKAGGHASAAHDIAEGGTLFQRNGFIPFSVTPLISVGLIQVCLNGLGLTLIDDYVAGLEIDRDGCSVVDAA